MTFIHPSLSTSLQLSLNHSIALALHHCIIESIFRSRRGSRSEAAPSDKSIPFVFIFFFPPHPGSCSFFSFFSFFYTMDKHK